LGWDQASLFRWTTLLSLLIDNVPQVASNLVEPGENALVLNTGYFGDSFADWCVHSSVVPLSQSETTPLL
jgi:hypothetical protein